MKTHDQSALTVLMVENDAGYGATLRIILRNIGINDVYETNNAINAFQILRKHRIDIVLSEHQLPKISGHALFSAIRSNRNHSFWSVPIICISQSCEKKHVITARDSGVDAFLVKPIRPSLLAHRFDRILSGERQAFDFWCKNQNKESYSSRIEPAMISSVLPNEMEDVLMI